MPAKLPRVGSIYGDLTRVALDVQRACGSTSLVWTDDIGDVFVSPCTATAASHNIVGVFTLGCSLDEIREDLQAMRTERARNWIVD